MSKALAKMISMPGTMLTHQRKPLGAFSLPTAWVRLATGLLFLVLLSGQYTFERAGIPVVMPSWLPERSLAVLALLVFALPAIFRIHPGMLAYAVQVNLVFAYLAISALWAGAESSIAVSGVAELGALMGIMVVAAGLASHDPRELAAGLAWGFATAGTLFGCVGIVLGGTAFGGGPNVYSRVTGLGVLAIVWLVSARRAPFWILTIVPLLMLATVYTGSRGGLLALSFGTLVLLSSLLRRSAIKWLKSAPILAIAGVLLWRYVGDRVSDVFTSRVLELTFEERYTSGRADLYAFALDLAREYPAFGAGLHGFATEYGATVGEVAYPHNMFLQFAAEGGALALLLVCASLGRVAVHWRVSLQPGPGSFVLAAATLLIVASQFSGGYYDQRLLWVFCIVYIGLTRVDDSGRSSQRRVDSQHVPTNGAPIARVGH